MPFDPNSFMEQSIDEPLSTQQKPIPEGEYLAMIDSFNDSPVREVTTKNGPRLILRVPYVLQDEALKTELGRDTVRVFQDLWLDTDSNGRLLTTGDSNVQLGKLRAAVGQNTSASWTPKKLEGAGPVKIVVKHRSDPKDPATKYTEVSRVTAA